MVRNVYGRRAGSLGGTVAFRRQDSKLISKLLGQFQRQLFGSDNSQIEPVELLLLAPFQVSAQECWRSEENRHAVLLRKPANLFGVERIDVIDDFGGQAHREPERTHVTQRMEDGNHSQHDVSIFDLKHLVGGVDRGRNVVLRQQNSLGFACFGNQSSRTG